MERKRPGTEGQGEGSERGLSAVGLGPTKPQATANGKPGLSERAGQVASSRVLDQGTGDVWEARVSSSAPPDHTLPPSVPQAAALPTVLGPGAQHMAPLNGFWHQRGIYFLDEAAKIVCTFVRQHGAVGADIF